MKITVREGKPPVDVATPDSFEHAIQDAASEAKANGRVHVIFLLAESGNEISFAVGSTETVLGFVHGHQNPPYLVSRGRSTAEEPVMTCFVAGEHHTEYPRSWVIPAEEGMNAIREFFASGQLPHSIEWQRT